MLPSASFPVEPRIVLVWVNPLIAGSNAIRYNLVGYVFRQKVGVGAEGTTSPQLFGAWASVVRPRNIAYDVMLKLTSDLANLLLVPLSVRTAQLFRNRAWVRILFQVQSVSQRGFENYLIEGPPSSIYHSTLALNASLFSIGYS